ncbi:actin-interacting protein 1-like [Babylonia areolata]|uniref:actin-interacting protein 1-like n=1 Tax=Babylonia areolata TaxID=304850 RepID=UPI003FD2AB8F
MKRRCLSCVPADKWARCAINIAYVSGKVLIWDAIKAEHPIISEYQALGGLIKDLDWSADSQHIVVCGNSNDRFGNVLCLGSGTVCGALGGHTQLVNTCSYRQSRPFCVVTASEDNTVGFHKGPPFKCKGRQKSHNQFVLVARYSHNGETAVSGGADGRQVLTASGDGTAKVFDLKSGDLVREFGSDISSSSSCSDCHSWHDMKLGCLWQNDVLLTSNARGHLIFHDQDMPEPRPRVVKGHMKPIRGMALSKDCSTIFTGSQEGISILVTGETEEVTGACWSGELVDMVVEGDWLICACSGSNVVHFFRHLASASCCLAGSKCDAVGMDLSQSSSRCTSSECCEVTGVQVDLDSQPNALDARNRVVVVACVGHVTVVQDHQKRPSLPVLSEATCVSIHPAAKTVAVGHKIRVVEMHSRSEVSAVAYAPCGAYLAVGIDKRVSALSAPDCKELSKVEVHTGRVCCVAWAPESMRFVTGALDGKVVVWDDVNNSYKKRPLILAHANSYANRIGWLNATTVVTAGQDSNVKQFNVTLDSSSFSAF